MPAESHRDAAIFAIAADDIDEAVELAVEHLKGIVEGEDLKGFVVPDLTSESFERVEGVWKRVFRFRAELLPAVA